MKRQQKTLHQTQLEEATARDQHTIQHLRASVLKLQGEVTALQTSLRETQASRDLAEERAVALQAKVDSQREGMVTMRAAIAEGFGNVVRSERSHGRTRGVLYVLTHLVLSGDVEAAKAVARGVADEVGT